MNDKAKLIKKSIRYLEKNNIPVVDLGINLKTGKIVNLKKYGKDNTNTRY